MPNPSTALDAAGAKPDLSVAAVEDRAIARHVAKTGQDRAATVDYYHGALVGKFGPVSEAGRAWVRRLLVAMGEPA